MNEVILSWGKCWIYVKKVAEEASKYIKFPVPVENSTQLNTTQGTKQEAKIEGGENEAVRYGRNTYALVSQVRIAANRLKPLADSDGKISGMYEVIVSPEDASAIGIKIDSAVVSCVTSYTSQDGLIAEYTFDAVKPAKGDTVKLGTVTVTGEDTEGESVTFAEAAEE